jgi:hypothetical protein
MRSVRIRMWVLILVTLVVSACAVVPRNRRKHLADPTMQPDEDVLRDRTHDKLHEVREGAAGGDGNPAGGGCGCN